MYILNFLIGLTSVRSPSSISRICAPDTYSSRLNVNSFVLKNMMSVFIAQKYKKMINLPASLCLQQLAYQKKNNYLEPLILYLYTIHSAHTSSLKFTISESIMTVQQL